MYIIDVPSAFHFQNGDQLFLTFVSLIIQSTSSCIIYHFVVKQLIHLIWYSIPYRINLATSYIPTKDKIYGFQIFWRKKLVIMYLLIPQATAQCGKCYCINEFLVDLRWAVVLEKKSVKTVHFLGIFTACTRRWWISNRDSYSLELLYNVMHILHSTYSFIPGGYRPKNLRVSNYKVYLMFNTSVS